MEREIKADSLRTSFYGTAIYVEAEQVDGGKASVTLIEIEDEPILAWPEELEGLDTLALALHAGLRFATTLVDD